MLINSQKSWLKASRSLKSELIGVLGLNIGSTEKSIPFLLVRKKEVVHSQSKTL